MVKILSQSGDSLAAMYDVKGSRAGIEHLETHELPIVHEMGATIFSERYSTIIRRSVTGDINQSTDFDRFTNDLPAVPTRLLAVTVLSDDAGRVGRAAVLARDNITGREIPLWVFDTAGGFQTVRMMEDGGAVTTFEVLRGQTDLQHLPNMVAGSGQPLFVDRLVLRGTTSGFGAGTVFVRALYYLAFAQIAGISSRGVPVPSW